MNESTANFLRLKDRVAAISVPSWTAVRVWCKRYALYATEWVIILAFAYLYCGQTLLNFDPQQLQQNGEHNESATLPLLAEIGLRRYGEIPLWNPYMLTGFPHAGDFVNHFWNPVATLPVWIWGGVEGMKVSVFLSFALAGIGQWLFAHVFGLRSIIRLWAALLFMVSGGLALLWRLGWYELLLGAVWFPWSFAAVWWSLRRRDRASLILAAFCIAMVISTGGGYYPLYLFVCLVILVGMAMLWARRPERAPMLRRAIAIMALSACLLAVMLLPLLDGYRYTSRDTLPDLQQSLSQPIPYALFNYVVSAPEWFDHDVLSKGSGWSWFYIGFLPLAALALLPLAYSKARWRRPALSTLVLLTAVLLAWQANRYLPVRLVYGWFPFLYTFRFPNRLLVIATAPLIVLAGLGLHHLLLVARRSGRRWRILVARDNADSWRVPLGSLFYAALLLVLAFTLKDVYTVNKGFGFAPQRLNEKSFVALKWLREYDPQLYYTSLGSSAIYWDWMPAAYELEMPAINFRYNRSLRSMVDQRKPESPFVATPQYIFALPGEPKPQNAQRVTEFDGVELWRLPDALPFAFGVQPALLQSTVTKEDVSPLTARLAGPNRVVVEGDDAGSGHQLVVLVSDYPGWRLLVDGRRAALQPANGYLGAMLRPGRHTYTFEFRPPKYYLGLAISAVTLLLMAGALLWDALPTSLLPFVRVTQRKSDTSPPSRI